VLDELAPTKRLHDVGVEATSMEHTGYSFLHRYRTGSHFTDIAARERIAKETTLPAWKLNLGLKE
jgi:hypothetical protein